MMANPHETAIALLERARAELARGHASDTTVGRREAQGASERTMPAEAAHSSGSGQLRSNEPGAESPNDPAPDIHTNSTGSLHGTGPEPSRGQLTSNLHGAKPGAVQIRKIAAKNVAGPARSDGNVHSNLPGHADSEREPGHAPEPVSQPADRNRTGDGLERTPPYAKEPLSGDGWSRAAGKARKLAPTR